MAQTTTNYGLLKPESTDSYNHLIYDNPNMDTIDAAMKANADAGVTNASCIKSGTTHTITRTNTDAPVIRFTATGDWNTGDTMIIDGVTVSPFLPTGEALKTGAYVINSEVLILLSGTRATVYSNQSEAIGTYFDDSNTSFTASNVQDAIEEVDTLAKGASDKIASLAVVTISQGSFTFNTSQSTYRSNSPAAVYTVRTILMVDVNLAGANNMIAHVNIDTDGHLVVTGVSPNGTKFNGNELFTVKMLCINP